MSQPTLLKPSWVFFTFVENIKSVICCSQDLWTSPLITFLMICSGTAVQKPNNKVINFTSTSSPFDLVHRHFPQCGCRNRCGSVRSGRSAPSVRAAVQHPPASLPPLRRVLFYTYYKFPLPDELCPNASI